MCPPKQWAEYGMKTTVSHLLHCRYPFSPQQAAARWAPTPPALARKATSEAPLVPVEWLSRVDLIWDQRVEANVETTDPPAVDGEEEHLQQPRRRFYQDNGQPFDLRFFLRVSSTLARPWVNIYPNRLGPFKKQSPSDRCPPHLQNCQELATRSEEFGQLVFELPPGHEQPETEMVGLQRYIMVKLRFPTVDLYPRSSWWAWEFPVHPTHLQTVAAFR